MKRAALAFALFTALPAAAAAAPANASANASANANANANVSANGTDDASAPAPTSPAPPPTPPAADVPTDCAFGIAVWCFVRSQKNLTAPDTKFRIEGFGGYKPSNIYYDREIRSCTEAGCTIKFAGPSFGLDAFYKLSGNSHSDDYFELGLSGSYMPIVTRIDNNTNGFDGELGRVAPGNGTLAYVPIRIALRRPSFFLIVLSKYIISSFGVGIAIPVTSGSGSTFTGGDGIVPTVGGRLGAQLPIGDRFQVGLATNWSVVWYGSSFGDASFQSSYGLNLAVHL